MSNGSNAEAANDISLSSSYHPNDGKSIYGGRDVVGYGPNRPKPKWPNGAKVALQIVLNYEEGGENCILHGDLQSESLMSEIIGAKPYGMSHHTVVLASL
jgi:hypothetical protein